MDSPKRTTIVCIAILAALFLARETVAWAWARMLDILSTATLNPLSWPWQDIVGWSLAAIALTMWLTTKRAPKPTPGDNVRALARRSEAIISRVRADRRVQWFEEQYTSDNSLDIARDGAALLLAYREAGLETPQFAGISSAEKACVGMEAYLSSMLPYVREGRVVQLKAMAGDVAKAADQRAAIYDPQQWRANRYG